MKYIVSFFVLFLLIGYTASAQVIINEELQQQDTVVMKAPVVDSTLVGISVFYLLGNRNHQGEGNVAINQPAYMADAFSNYIAGNTHRKKNGYRVRIFFDNKQSARGESEGMVKSFTEKFRDTPAYRSYSAPYFKVVVGDYRTKSDAIKALNSIKESYPKAVIVKEVIGFPAI